MELQKEAVSCGVDSLQYWQMTPRDIRAAIEGFNSANKRDFESKMAVYNHVAWLTGQYFGIAQHNPQKYPRKPFELEERDPPAPMSDVDMEVWARNFAQKMKD